MGFIWDCVKAMGFLYAVGTGVVLADYHLSHKDWIKNEQQSTLRVEDHLIERNREEATLRFIGETHIYTTKDSEHAQEIAPSCDVVLAEGSSRPLTKEEKWSLTPFAAIYSVSHFFKSMGSDRSFSNKRLLRFSRERKTPIYRIEEETNGGTDVIPTSTLTTMYIGAAASALIAPITYFKAKEKAKALPEDMKPSSYDMFAGPQRDIFMSQNVADIVNRTDFETYCINTGIAHTKHMVREVLESLEEQPQI